MVKRFEKAVGAAGLGVGAALEAALAKWTYENDGPGGRA
jgi:hypothetical protein